MFISYIISPLCGETYLARCIESLYEQTEDDFEVIVAEYHFHTCSEYIKETLETKPNFKIIAECQPKDKLMAAVKMADEQTQFIQLVDANAVATPNALKSIKAVSENADLIVPSTILRTAEGFVRRFPDGWENAGQMDILDAFDYCFRKSLFDIYADEILSDPGQVETLVDILLSRNTPFAFVKEICYYVTKPKYVMTAAEKLDYEKLSIIAASLSGITINANIVKLFTKYVHRLTYVIDSGRYNTDEQQQALNALKEFGNPMKEYYVMSKIFALNTGVPIEDLQVLDLGGYQTLRKEVLRLSGTENGSGNVGTVMERFERQCMDFVKEMETNAKQIGTAYTSKVEDLDQIQENIAAISANLHCLMQKAEGDGFQMSGTGNVSSFSNPVTEVPYLYATGRLGLKSILKSFNGWLRFKFSHKK